MFSLIGQPNPVSGQPCSAHRAPREGRSRCQVVRCRAVVAGRSIPLSTGGEIRKLHQP